MKKIKKNKLETSQQTCECGKYSFCCRKIHSSPEGRLWIESSEHFQCGKVQEQILKGKNLI